MRRPRPFRRKNAKKNPRHFRGIKLLLILLALCAGIFALDRATRPTIETMIGYKAKITATKLINDGVYQQLEALNFSYQDLVAISKDADGNIQAIETDTIKVNQIKTSVIKAVGKAAEELSVYELNIPVGTLTGVPWLSARGPSVSIKMIPQGVIKAQFVSEFVSAGVNQTHHRLIMNVSMTASAVIPGFTSQVEVLSDFLIAETVIVGDVPEYYTQIITSDEEILEKTDAYDRSQMK